MAEDKHNIAIEGVVTGGARLSRCAVQKESVLQMLKEQRSTMVSNLFSEYEDIRRKAY
jgi:hypothetical protein